MIKIIDAKVPSKKTKQTKQREKLQEAKGLVVGNRTFHIFSDEEKVAEFIDHMELLASWLKARFIDQEQKE